MSKFYTLTQYPNNNNIGLILSRKRHIDTMKAINTALTSYFDETCNIEDLDLDNINNKIIPVDIDGTIYNISISETTLY